MKKEPKVEYGITITKPWSKEMYAHNEQVAEIVRAEVHAIWLSALNEFQAGSGEEFMSDVAWRDVPRNIKKIQKAVTCYGFGDGYDVADVARQVEQELENAPSFRLKEIAEELQLVLDKGFVGFNQPANFSETKLTKDQDYCNIILIFKYKKK